MLKKTIFQSVAKKIVLEFSAQNNLGNRLHVNHAAIIPIFRTHALHLIIQMPMIRKEFIRKTGLATASLAVVPALAIEKNVSPVRLGMIGVGLRGQDHLSLLLKRSDVEVVAIADIDQRMLKSATDLFTRENKKQPDRFHV